MDDTPIQQNENTPNITVPEPTKLKRSQFSNKMWKNPYALVFAIVFAGIGGFAIINSLAATASLTKVWQTSADWSAGTLSSTSVVNNSVTLTPLETVSSTERTADIPAIPAEPAPAIAASTTNLALNKRVVASSQNDDNQPQPKDLPPKFAVDGDLKTRWGSQYKSPQWIYVDLGSIYNINRVQLNWETAYGKAYKIQVSNDAKNWTTVYSTKSGKGGVNNITGLKASGRFVRMHGTVRGTVWGYSLYEMSVYGANTATSTPPTADYNLTVTKPTGSQTVSGRASFSGTQSKLKNVEVWYNGANVGTAKISGNTWTASVDTTKQTNGAQTYTVYGWDVAAGQQASKTITKPINLNVSNTAPTPAATVYPSSGTIELTYDAGTSVGWSSLAPQADTPSGTSITYQARTSADNKTWSAWGSDVAKLTSGRYIQIKATLSTTNKSATPTLKTLTLGYNAPIASPTATITATPTTVAAGQNVTITWNSANATTCTASGGWTGVKAVSGSVASAALSATTSFNIACSGQGGTANASATVTVTPAPTTGGTSPTGGCAVNGVLAPCIGSATTGASGWGAPVFSDDFNGTSLDGSKWSSTWFNGGCCQNGVTTSASNVKVANGEVILTLSSSSVGASINTNPNDGGKAGFQFGNGYYVEGRVWFQGSGTSIDNWPAFWTNGIPWPDNGEADVAEGYDGTLSSPYHYSSNGQHVADNGQTIPGNWGGAYHTYAVDRQNGQNYIYWDGKLVRSYATHDGGAPQFIILNIGTRGQPAGTQVKADYVRIWKK